MAVESCYFYLETPPPHLVPWKSAIIQTKQAVLVSLPIARASPLFPGGPMITACPSRSSDWLRSEHVT